MSWRAASAMRPVESASRPSSFRCGTRHNSGPKAMSANWPAVMALQSEVAQKVAGSLALKLLPAEQARLANVHAINPEAYEAYLKGLQPWYKLTPEDIDTARRYFEQALEKDPNYALAHVGIALVWVGRQQMGVTAPREAGPKAKAAALKAVALDNTLAQSTLRHWRRST